MVEKLSEAVMVMMEFSWKIALVARKVGGGSEWAQKAIPYNITATLQAVGVHGYSTATTWEIEEAAHHPPTLKTRRRRVLLGCSE